MSDESTFLRVLPKMPGQYFAIEVKHCSQTLEDLAVVWLLICLIIEHGAGKWVRRSEGADRYLGKYLGRKLRTTQVVLLLINQRCCTITEKAPTRAFTWLKAATTAFTFKTLLRHYAKQALTPW